MGLTALYFGFGLLTNLYFNFYIDFQWTKTYAISVGLWSFLVGISQGGSVFYAISMLRWYWSMASRNMHAVEESIAGSTYNKAEHWGMGQRSLRIYLYTKESVHANLVSMFGTYNFFRAMAPVPLNFMSKVGSF